ncbi:MAG TPA: hypothetical protein VHC97_18690 [Thermoanaerobaculia bacterium]|jgi:hypothetical protein|nr:hypothetical protein [Thermoanaerobaculia bacterium]
MRSSRHSSSSRNAFRRSFLRRISERDEPPTGGEADAAGPWWIEELPGGRFGLFRRGESHARGFEPAAVFRDRSVALLAAAVLPGTGRDAAFRLHKDDGPEGFLVETGNGGEPLGHLAFFDENLIAALHVVETLVRSPESLANLLEAAGPLALERAGAILEERI